MPKPSAITNADADALVLWAESPEEARTFLERAARAGSSLEVERIFVAKRSPTVRANRYVGGEYLATTDDAVVDVLPGVVEAPAKVVDLVQWCTCDVMLSRGAEPIVVVEDTTHIVRMNLYQRFPRLARAASLGVPGAVFQGTRGLDLSKRGDEWGLHRYLSAFAAIEKVHPQSAVLPLWYLPSDAAEDAVERDLFHYVEALVAADGRRARAVLDAQLARVAGLLAAGVHGEPVPDVPSIDHTTEADVVVRIGANPDVKSWREKGSGQMDPYVGMILAARYLHCHDAQGRRVRRLRVDFTKLPPGFWFFRDGRQSNALYKRLPMEFPDEVRFLG